MSLLATLDNNTDDSMSAPKGIIYGSIGVGKTIFGLNASKRFVLNCENGAVYTKKGVTDYLRTWNEMQPWLEAIAYEEHDYKTFVVDTIDWLLRRIEEHVSGTDGKGKGLEATLNRSHGGYGNGKQVLMNYVYQEVLPLLDKMVERGISVVLLAHAARQNFTNIDGITIEKSSPDIHPVLQTTFVEWSDFVGAAKVEGDDRVLFLTETSQFLAKNRYGIVDPIRFDWDEFCGAIGNNFKKLTSELLKEQSAKIT